MSVDVYFLFEYYVVSYFENIPSLQCSANALTVAHVNVSTLKKTCNETCVSNVGHANHRKK